MFEIIFILSAFLLGLLFVKLTIIVACKKKIFDYVDERKVHSGNIPRLGGIGLFLSFFVVLACYIFFLKKTVMKELPLLLGAFGIWIIGIADDLKNMPAKVKFILQILCVTVTLVFSPFYIERFFIWNLPTFAAKAVSVLWILYLINAFNLIDGIDLLCSGLSFLSVITLISLFYMENIDAVPCGILAASILGFMFFNRPSAKIFLGDGGSQTLGYFIASMPLILNDTPCMRNNRIFVMFLLSIVPAVDVIAAIWRRIRDHRSIFSADRSHIHHKLLNIGFSKIIALAYLLGIQFVCCVTVFFCRFAGPLSSFVIMIMVIFFVSAFFITIHYLNRSASMKLKKSADENSVNE